MGVVADGGRIGVPEVKRALGAGVGTNAASYDVPEDDPASDGPGGGGPERSEAIHESTRRSEITGVPFQLIVMMRRYFSPVSAPSR